MRFYAPSAPRFLSEAKKELSPAIVVGSVRFFDAILLVCATGLSFLTYYPNDEHINDNLTAAVLVILGVLNVFGFTGLYEFDRLRTTVVQVRNLLVIWSSAFLLLLLGAFFLKVSDELSRGWIATWYVLGAALLLGHRAVLSVLFRRWMDAGRLTRRIVVVGAGELGQRFISHIHSAPTSGVSIVGVFDDRVTRIPAEVGGLQITGGLASLVAFCRSNPVQTVVIALPLSAEARLIELIGLLSPLPVDVKLLPDLAGFHFLNKPLSYLAQIPVLSAFERPMKDWGAVVKRTEDLLLASILAVATAPLMLMIACAVKIDSPGPVLFRQKRYGFNHRLIEVFKFRTMYHDRSDANATKLVSRNDDRVTRLGRILRRSSLDELPQIYNVVLGTMSLVGPRPHAVNAKAADKLYDEAVANYAARHRVKPGITGWAQVNGLRGETDTVAKIEARVEHDLYYIDRWSPTFDLWIMFLTIFKGFSNPNAF